MGDWRTAHDQASEADWGSPEADWTLRKVMVRSIAALLLLSLVATLAASWRGIAEFLAVCGILAVALLAAKAAKRRREDSRDANQSDGPSSYH